MCDEQSGDIDSQVLQYLGIPEALSGIDVGNIVGRGNVPDSGISSGGDPQVLLETRDGTGGTGLILQITGRSPGIEVRFQNLRSEIVILHATPWVVSACLKTVFSRFT